MLAVRIAAILPKISKSILPRVAYCVDQAISEKMSQLTRQLDELSTVREGANPHGCITFLQGAAHFVDSKTVQVTSEQIMQRTTVTADYFIIATGSRPKIIDAIDIDGHFIMTSDHQTAVKTFSPQPGDPGGWDCRLRVCYYIRKFWSN